MSKNSELTGPITVQEVDIEDLLKAHHEARKKGQISELDFYVSMGIFSWEEINDLDKRFEEAMEDE